MAEQAVWHIKRVTLAIPVPSIAAIRTRIWMLGPPLLLGLLGALIATQLQTRAWRSEAKVAIDLSHLGSIPASFETTRYLEARAATLARSQQLAVRVVSAAGVPGITAAEFLRHSSAKPESDADILTLSVTYRKRAPAVRLANAYATELKDYNTELQTAKINATIAAIEKTLKPYRVAGKTTAPTYLGLSGHEGGLRTLRASLAANTSVQLSESASTFRPHALRNGLLGGALGVLVGVALVLGVVARSRRAH
jgi:capsular polysaccharide biosynthesis protein